MKRIENLYTIKITIKFNKVETDTIEITRTTIEESIDFIDKYTAHATYNGAEILEVKLTKEME